MNRYQVEMQTSLSAWQQTQGVDLQIYNADIQKYSVEVQDNSAEYQWLQDQYTRLKAEYDSAFMIGQPKQQPARRKGDR